MRAQAALNFALASARSVALPRSSLPCGRRGRWQDPTTGGRSCGVLELSTMRPTGKPRYHRLIVVGIALAGNHGVPAAGERGHAPIISPI